MASERLQRRRVLSALLTLPVGLRAGAELPIAPSTTVAGSLQPIMRQVLSGDLDAALNAAEQRLANAPNTLLESLMTEVSDLKRGNYATTGNRAFAALAPHWRAARAAWVRRYELPQGLLPAQVLELPNCAQRIVLVDVSRAAAWLFSRSENLPWQIEDGFYISVGAAGADKRRRGDRRTPLGVYWPVDQLDADRLPARYGERVFPLDYPNGLDRFQRRTGNGIWLHGIAPGNNVRPPRDTDGCIALANDRVVALGERLVLGETPVLIAQSLEWTRPETLAEITRSLKDALEGWRASIVTADIVSYLNHHASDYTRFGKSPSLWRAGRRAAFRARTVEEMSVDELSVFLADADEKIYLTRFRQTQRREEASPIITMRRLYWQRQADRWKIIAEQNG